MAYPIKFQQQNFAYTCPDIPGCETLHVHQRPDAILGVENLSAHQLTEAELAEVVSSGVVFLGVFGHGHQPVHLYGGTFPYPVEQIINESELGDRTITTVLDTAASVSEFLELWRWIKPEVQQSAPVLNSYRLAEAKWPGVLYPSKMLTFTPEAPPTYAQQLARLGWRDPATDAPNFNWYEGDRELFVPIQGLREHGQVPEPVAYSETEKKWYTWASVDGEGEAAPLVEVTNLIGWQPFAYVPELPSPEAMQEAAGQQYPEPTEQTSPPMPQD